MNQWAFVIAAYAVVLGGMAALLVWAHASMRRAEHQASRLSERR